MFTPSSRLPDTAMTVGDGNNSPEESVSHMTSADGNCCDRMVGNTDSLLPLLFRFYSWEVKQRPPATLL